MIFTQEDVKDLQRAKKLLENPGFGRQNHLFHRNTH